MFLTPEEIAQLTGRVQRRAQRTVLNALGVVHKVRPDGSLVVLRAHVEKELGGGATTGGHAEFEPDWSSLK